MLLLGGQNRICFSKGQQGRFNSQRPPHVFKPILNLRPVCKLVVVPGENESFYQTLVPIQNMQ